MKWLLVFMLAGLAGSTFAATGQKPVSAATAEEFAEQADKVRGEMRRNGRYGEISSRNRERVEAELDRMEQLLARHRSVEEMGPRERTDLFNAQERANALLAGNDGERLRCQMVEPTGSKMRQRECRKLSDIRRTREAHRDGLRDQTRRLANSGTDL